MRIKNVCEGMLIKLATKHAGVGSGRVDKLKIATIRWRWL